MKLSVLSPVPAVASTLAKGSSSEPIFEDTVPEIAPAVPATVALTTRYSRPLETSTDATVEPTALLIASAISLRVASCLSARTLALSSSKSIAYDVPSIVNVPNAYVERALNA
jgi:hypothetical protein